VRYHNDAMLDNFREFDAGPDPLGKTWHVEFVWLQTAIAIRHADAVDVKFFVSDGDRKLEKVIALPHVTLRKLAEQYGRPLSDPWCSRLAALHIKHMIETSEDMEKTLVTVSPEQLERYAAELAGGGSSAPQPEPALKEPGSR